MCIKLGRDKVANAIRGISNKTSEVYSAWVLKVHFVTMMFRSWYNYNHSSIRLTDNNQRRWEYARRNNEPSSAS